MLKRLSSLILVVVVSGSVFAGTARLRGEHVCNMTGMETMLNGEHTPGMKMSGMEHMSGMEMPDSEACHMQMFGVENMAGMETMPCCKKDHASAATEERSTMGACCVTIPQEPGSTGTTFKLSPPSFSVAAIHPAIAQSPVILPKRFECPYSDEFFLPNLQASYIRNLSLLI
ncbi:MAG TPA: hypothetical protein VIT88_09790 [Pyrinomonadaceae bacterium]